MTKAILFDFWGTLAENGIASPLKLVKEVLQIAIPFSEYVPRMERAMMVREFPSLREAFEEVFREFSIPLNEEQLEQCIGLWNKSWMLAKPYEDTVQTLLELQKEYSLILISNTDCFSVTRVLEKFQLGQLFEKKYFSYEKGLLKNDPTFLAGILEELNLVAEECLLVGDSMESDIAAAHQAGIKAVLIDRRNRRDFHPKITSMNQLPEMLNP